MAAGLCFSKCTNVASQSRLCFMQPDHNELAPGVGGGDKAKSIHLRVTHLACLARCCMRHYSRLGRPESSIQLVWQSDRVGRAPGRVQIVGRMHCIFSHPPNLLNTTDTIYEGEMMLLKRSRRTPQAHKAEAHEEVSK